MQPSRRQLEPGIYERVGADGRRLGLDIVYKDAAGKTRRRSVNGDIRAARNELALARSRRVRQEHEPADPRMTLATVITRYEAAHAGDRPSTRSVRRSAFKRIIPALGDKRIVAITRADVRKFVSDEVAEGLKANTIRSHYSVLRAAFNFAATDLDILVPFPRLKPGDLPDPAEDQREHRVLSDEELSRVLSSCSGRSRLFFRTLAETGCRCSEALGLTPERVGDGVIKFERQMARDGSLRPLKTRQSKRTIEIALPLSAELRLAGDKVRVFPRLSHREIERQWAAALQHAGLEDPQPVPHDLRHTHASRLIAAGWDPVEIAQRLGDRVETLHRVYFHEFDARRRSSERRAALEAIYGAGMATGMATQTPQQTATEGAKVQRLRALGDKP